MKLFIVLLFLNVLLLACCVNPPPSRARVLSQSTARPQGRGVTRFEATGDLEDPENSKHMNPVSRLNLMQSKKGKPMPTYQLLEVVNETNIRGNVINQRFHYEARLERFSGNGWGPTKKAAKREAARQLLADMSLPVEAA